MGIQQSERRMNESALFFSCETEEGKKCAATPASSAHSHPLTVFVSVAVTPLHAFPCGGACADGGEAHPRSRRGAGLRHISAGQTRCAD